MIRFFFRYNTDGFIDTDFNNSGFYVEGNNLLQETAESLANDAQGNIVIAGEYENGANNKIFLSKYTSAPLSVSTNEIDENLKYNNPVQNRLSVASSRNIDSILLFSFDGKLIQTASGHHVDTSGLSEGLYFAKVIFSNKYDFKILKIIKR